MPRHVALSAKPQRQPSTPRAPLQVIARLDVETLAARAPSDLLPGLFAALKHPRTDVRQRAVHCLVELMAALGDRWGLMAAAGCCRSCLYTVNCPWCDCLPGAAGMRAAGGAWGTGATRAGAVQRRLLLDWLRKDCSSHVVVGCPLL